MLPEIDWTAEVAEWHQTGEWNFERLGHSPIHPDTDVPRKVREAFKLKIDPGVREPTLRSRSNGRSAEPPPSQAPQPSGSAEQATGGSDDGYTAQLIAEMTATGIEVPPDRIIADNNIHRFVSRPGSKKKNGWYVIHPDPVAPGWAFGDWSLDIKKRGEGDPGRELTPEEVADRKKRQREQQERIEAEEARAHGEAAAEAQQRWDQAAPAQKDHSYLKSKQIDPCGARVEGRNLIIPMRDIKGKLWSLQAISPDGHKHNQEGGRRKGCFFQIGEIGDTILVGEGYSTCATLHMATSHAVISAGEAGNLETVAVALRKKYPVATIIICGDDDWLTKVNGKPHNTGKIKAQKAAEAVDGVLALPWFSESARPRWAKDFNDMASLSGLDEVATRIKLDIIKHEEDLQRKRDAEPPHSGEGAEQPEEHATDDDIGDDDKASAADDEQIRADRKEVKSALDAAIDDMNLKYCVVNDGGSVLIFMDRFDESLERRVYDRMRQGSLMLLHANEKICTSVSPEGKRTYKPLASVWLSNKRRRDYKKGVVFDPTTTESQNGKLNLWRGFGYEPKPGRWARMKDHLQTIVCNKNEEHFIYLMGWMACAVQHPADQGEVAVVLRGGQGVGKGILGHTLRKLFGQHGMYISKSKHLVGAFNAHLRDCVVLFADEAFFAGDKAAEGTLKSLITEETLTIEPKGQNVILSKNHLHTIMASNEKWVIPAGLDERRFFVLDVPNTHKGDLQYFKNIIKELESGGYAAMLHELLNYDISNFDVRRVPATAALDEQKKLSLPPEMQWWLGVLSRGYVYRSKYGLENHFGQWHDFMSTDVLYDSYMDHARSRNDRYPMASVSFGKFMTGLGCKPVRSSGADVTGEHQVRGDYDGILRAGLIKKDRPRGYRIGTLEQARTEFENHTGMSFTWEPEEEQRDEDPS